MRAVIIIDDATTLTETVALALASARTDRQTIVVPSRQEGSDRPRDADWSALIPLLQELGLTPRECDVVIRDLQGFSRAEIAAQLHLEAVTIKTYWRGIYRKLGLHQRSDLPALVLAFLLNQRTAAVGHRAYEHRLAAGSDPIRRSSAGSLSAAWM